jgi:biopolymer transport protein ExbB
MLQLLLQSNDHVTVALAWGLLVCSIATWSVIAYKIVQATLLHNTIRKLQRWYSLHEVPFDQWIKVLPTHDNAAVMRPWIRRVVMEVQNTSHQEKIPLPDRLEHQLLEYLSDWTQQTQRGLTFLATVASATPFVGLLGTVWGIYLALVGMQGNATSELMSITGPIGEALLMTALGLIVAIPALVGYNVLQKIMHRRIEAIDHLATRLQHHVPYALDDFRRIQIQ